jgi:hypothetical protein
MSAKTINPDAAHKETATDAPRRPASLRRPCAETPNAATLAAMRDVDAGRVTRFSSPKKLFASWGK